MSARADTGLRLAARSLDAFTARELLALARLRIDVFVVEQACPYPELDALDADPRTAHVTGHLGGHLDDRSGEELVACARTLPPTETGVHAGGATRLPGGACRIGRVAVRDGYRDRGLARALMRWTLATLAREYPGHPVALGAQLAAEGFYASLGFRRASDEYVEDGIAHVEMVRAAGPIGTP